MSHSITISDELYRRLAAYARGFESPENVIERIVNIYEARDAEAVAFESRSASSEVTRANNLEIFYFAGSEEKFKEQLLSEKKAFIKIYYTNGNTELKEWNASYRFSSDSHVEGNLRSGYLRGWKDKGICRAELSVNRGDLA